MKLKLSLIGFSCVLLALSSCKPKIDYEYYSEKQAAKLTALNLPENAESLDYSVDLPKHLIATGLFTRPVEGNKARLGRVIFYDKSLSSDNKVSCASCHLQKHAFADMSAKSKGVDDRETARNSIALSSVVNFSAYYGTDINGSGAIRFFWDNRAETVAEQTRGAFTNPDEMNMHMNEIIAAIREKEYYLPLFQKAYNTNPEDDETLPVIDETKVFDAMSHFINSLGSYRSRFDAAADKLVGNIGNGGVFFGGDLLTGSGDFADFTAQENAGKTLYMTNCASCHSSSMGRPVLNSANNGLDLEYTDHGVGGISGVLGKKDEFKVPTLRNIANSAPYMHDGRFSTLEQVIDHYSNGVQNHPALHANLKTSNGSVKKMNFTEAQKAELIAFLKTVNDAELVVDERYSDPFK